MKDFNEINRLLAAAIVNPEVSRALITDVASGITMAEEKTGEKFVFNPKDLELLAEAGKGIRSLHELATNLIEIDSLRGPERKH